MSSGEEYREMLYEINKLDHPLVEEVRDLLIEHFDDHRHDGWEGREVVCPVCREIEGRREASRREHEALQKGSQLRTELRVVLGELRLLVARIVEATGDDK